MTNNNVRITRADVFLAKQPAAGGSGSRYSTCWRSSSAVEVTGGTACCTGAFGAFGQLGWRQQLVRE